MDRCCTCLPPTVNTIDRLRLYRRVEERLQNEDVVRFDLLASQAHNA